MSGRGKGRGYGGSNGLFFNVVDCQDFKQHFHPSEMQQMGDEGNPTSLRNAQRPTRKGMVTNTAPEGMRRKSQLVTIEMKKKRTKILPRNPSWRKET